MPRKQEIFANKPKSKHFKLHFSIYNSIAFAGEKPSQNSHRFVFASLRGREPSQSSHSFACKQAKRDIFASRKVGFLSPEPPHSLAGLRFKNNQNYKRSVNSAQNRNGTAKTSNFPYTSLQVANTFQHIVITTKIHCAKKRRLLIT